MEKLDLMVLALLLNRIGGEAVFSAEEMQELRSIANLQIESNTTEQGALCVRLVQGEDEHGFTYH